MPNRQAGDNICRAVLLAHIAKKQKIPLCFLSLDIKRAFDTVSWQYMQYSLQKWGFGPHFLTWIKALYNKPKAYIKYAGYKSDAFNIERGTRQGCPLSPLLFALILEPMAQYIRTNQTITGIEVGGITHKLCIFADDILLFLSSPQVSGPNLIPALDGFAALSGLMINPKKCLVLNISLTNMELIPARAALPFTWAEKSIPYLGIHLTASHSDLFSTNYPPVLRQITNLIKQWSQLPLSWIGKINAIKMTILPKLLYLFRVLPIPIPSYFLRIVQKRATSFIWGSSKPRIPIHTLHLPKNKGGLGYPNFTNYYRAAHLASLSKYHAKQEIPLWVFIEASENDPLLISNLLWLDPKDRFKIHNPITKHFLSLWDKLKTKYQLQSPHNPLLSFIRNPAFYPAWIYPNSFKAWTTSGIQTLNDFIASKSFLSFPSLREKYDLPNSEIFRYLQIKNFYTPFLKGDTPLSQLSIFESICTKDPFAKGTISSLYNQLYGVANLNRPSYVQRWEEDLGRTLEDTDWSNIWLTSKSSSPNILALETNYKVLTRWYLVPARVAKYSPNTSALCFRGCPEIGTHLHIWWTCPVIQTFWKEVFVIASKIFKKIIQPDPYLTLLNLKPEWLTLSQFKLMIQLITAAKQTVAKAWKSPTLVLAETIHRMNNTMSHAKMVAIDQNQIPKFEKLWHPWIKQQFLSNFNDSVLLPW